MSILHSNEAFPDNAEGRETAGVPFRCLNHGWYWTGYIKEYEPLQVFGVQKLCELVLRLSGPENQGGPALLRGAPDTQSVP
ncbi:unnamed protein product [Pleuronectes platessa]|uniref:Uncharacterized protein n=1 Tax=Pleuronectes platessa TaxID=8262 RepID=A0A9N7UTD6_PLEPL|nr:unnamed protein product [Pleuronectes platessa]